MADRVSQCRGVEPERQPLFHRSVQRRKVIRIDATDVCLGRLLADGNGQRTLIEVDLDLARLQAPNKVAQNAGLDGRLAFFLDGGFKPNRDADLKVCGRDQQLTVAGFNQIVPEYW